FCPGFEGAFGTAVDGTLNRLFHAGFRGRNRVIVDVDDFRIRASGQKGVRNARAHAAAAEHPNLFRHSHVPSPSTLLILTSSCRLTMPAYGQILLRIQRAPPARYCLLQDALPRAYRKAAWTAAPPVDPARQSSSPMRGHRPRALLARKAH